ncbi:MAG: hypothetical protein ACM3ZQ_05530 [Bacillota bacterium]
MRRRTGVIAVVLVLVLLTGAGAAVLAGEPASLDTEGSFDLTCAGAVETKGTTYLRTDTDSLGEQFSLSEYHGSLYTVPKGAVITISANEPGVEKAINAYVEEGTELRPERWHAWFGGPFGLDLISPPDYDQPQQVKVGTPFTYTASKGGVYLFVDVYTPQAAMQQYLFYVEDTPVVPTTVSAAKNASVVYVDGVSKSFDAYTIEGNNYFKLRDLAFVLNGTRAGFGVRWDGEKNAISLDGGQAYVPVGGEMAVSPAAGNVTATSTDSAIYINGSKASVSGYNINGSNYFKLRDIGQHFNFRVAWDPETSSIHISTKLGYSQ